MKALLILALASSAFGQTAISLNQVKVPVQTVPSILTIGFPGQAGGIGIRPTPQIPAMQPNQIYQLTSVLASITLSCRAGDIYWNGLLLSEGVDYSLDAAGLVATFLAASTPQPGDVVKVVYRC
jgi:hypothetical protein